VGTPAHWARQCRQCRQCRDDHRVVATFEEADAQILLRRRHRAPVAAGGVLEEAHQAGARRALDGQRRRAVFADVVVAAGQGILAARGHQVDARRRLGHRHVGIVAAASGQGQAAEGRRQRRKSLLHARLLHWVNRLRSHCCVAVRAS